MLGMIYGDFAEARWVDSRESNVIDGAAPFYNVYECSDGLWLAVACIEPAFYTAFLEAAALREDVFKDQWNRSLWPAQKELLEKRFRMRARSEWLALFEPHDACVTPVLSLSEAQQHPHNLARAAFVNRQGIAQPAPAPRFSVTTPGIQGELNETEAASVLERWRREALS